MGVSNDLSVGRAVAVRDSIRLVQMRDSLVTACTALIDSAAIQGIRADSTRVACMRSDTARVRAVLFDLAADATNDRKTLAVIEDVGAIMADRLGNPPNIDFALAAFLRSSYVGMPRSVLGRIQAREEPTLYERLTASGEAAPLMCAVEIGQHQYAIAIVDLAQGGAGAWQPFVRIAVVRHFEGFGA